ncbi:MAG: FliI/YscN family ATPase [Actinobacteria bacterium]|nr:FliI/YscN family ATPase [Actinomycetota bacterium]
MTLAALRTRAADAVRPDVHGSVTSVTGLTAWVEGIDAAVGDVVALGRAGGVLPAEVVGADSGRLACMPLGPTNGLGPGVPARATGRPLTVPVGPALLGRVLDGLGRPVDGGPSLDHLPRVPIENAAPHAMRRQLITEQMGLGVRALDTLTPVGRGQRIGIMAGSGVGKSTLLSMIARGTTADVVVAALVGERGREVREFLENDLGAEGLARSVVVVATSDEPPVVRLRAAFAATRIAEDFRDQGLDVLLFMDSVTRTAMAQREVGLSAGEPPATRGYPPSAFAMLPRLLERTGPGETGTITGIYTVLVEGDDIQDPIGDTTRSILDGHIVLDRGLANAHHYPAVDVLGSVSRLAGTVTTPEQQRDAATLRRLMAAHREAKLLIDVGAYVPGTDPDVDLARALAPRIDAFLQQTVHEHAGLDDAWARLHELVGGL